MEINPYVKAAKARARSLTPRRRKEIARNAALATHEKRRANRLAQADVAMMAEIEDAAAAALEQARDPIAWFAANLIDPDTERPFVFYPEQERFLREALTPTPTWGLPYSEVVFSAPKKSGKTRLAAMALLYVVVAVSGASAEAYIASNSREQANERVFQDVAELVKHSPTLRGEADIRMEDIRFSATNAIIRTRGLQAASSAGSRPNIVVFDELWGFVSVEARRLWDEMVPTPTKPASMRLTVTYAGFEGESELLLGLYRRVFNPDGNLQEGVEELAPDLYRKGRTLVYWTHDLRAPWQSPEWVEQMREAYSPSQFARIIENRWTSSSNPFVPIEDWDRCIDVSLRRAEAPARTRVFVGVDASVRRDSTAIVAVAREDGVRRPMNIGVPAASRNDDGGVFVPLWARGPGGMVTRPAAIPMTQPRNADGSVNLRLVWHRVFTPTRGQTIDFEQQVEAALLELKARFQVSAVYFDPYQMISSAQRLMRRGLAMIEFPQTPQNLTEATTNLYETIISHRIRLYADEEMRMAVARAIAVEMPRGWKIAKEKRTHRIDVVVALAQAALAAARAESANEIEDRLAAGLSAAQLYNR